MNISLRVQADLRGYMNENRESLPIHITVDSTKIARCQWCGSIESDNWRVNRYGVYCSDICAAANVTGLSICTSLFFVFLSLITVAAMEPSSWASGIGIPLLFILLALPGLLCGAIGLEHRKKVPRNSRRDDISSDLALLRAISSEVSCPKCNGNIDVGRISKDRVYRCQYCGATGTIEVIKAK